MYLRSLSLRHVKLVERLDLDFTDSQGESRMWTLVVGENGTCKTTILQAIALAASGEVLAGKLASNGRIDLVPSLRHRNYPRRKIKIEAEFGFGTIGHARGRLYPGLGKAAGRRGSAGWQPPRLTSKLTVAPRSRKLDGHALYGEGATQFGLRDSPVDQLRGADPIEPHWFVAGYGVERNLPRPERASVRDPAQERLSSLFGAGDIASTRFADSFRLSNPKLADAYEFTLDAVLTTAGLLPGVTRVDLGRHGAESEIDRQVVTTRIAEESVSVPGVWLSQGYQSSIAWIADLVGHVLLEADDPVPPDEMEGLVLVDEIDLHLHPTWQVSLVGALRRVFPKLQFVATTHSPLVLPAVSRDEIVRLDFDESGGVVRAPKGPVPHDMTGTELLREYFEIEHLIPSPIGQLRWEYGRLATDSRRSDRDEARLDAIERELETLRAPVPALPRVARR